MSARGVAAALAFAAAACGAASAADPGFRVAQSRESLFSDLDAADTEKEAIGAKGVRWGGFLNETVAYTYSDPSHWSRAVTRLQLYAQGVLAPGVKWYASGRVDADPVYMYSNFYPGDVKKDQRLDFFIRETWLDFSAGDLDFRIGRQHIVWGEVVGLYFADVVSGRDQRDFILPGFDIMRIPQWAARAEWFGDALHAEAIWIPIRSFDDIGEPGAEFYPAGRSVAALPPGVNAVFQDPQRPANTMKNSNYGLRLSGTAANWDWSAFFFRSYSAGATFYRDIIPGAVPTAVFTPRYDRITQYGATASHDFGAFVLRAEAVYTQGQRFSVASLAEPEGVVARNTFEWILSADVPMQGIGRDTRLNLQFFERNFLGGDADIVPQVGGYGASVLVSTRVTPEVEPSLLVIQGLSVNDRMIRPRVSWYFAKNWVAAAGVDIFAGPETGFFGRFANRDRVYAELRYDF